MARNYYALCALLILAAACATLYAWPQLPAQIPTHWNMHGQPDDYSPRWAIWLLGPGLMAAIAAVFAVLPRISPARYGMERFTRTYYYFMLVIVAFVGYVHATVLASLLTGAVGLETAIPAGVCVLFILLGNPMGKVTPNFFIGIRTPWTLASARVWHATHRLGAKLMVASGVVGLAGILAGAPSWLFVAAISVWAPLTVLYSLLLYKRLQRSGQLEQAS